MKRENNKSLWLHIKLKHVNSKLTRFNSNECLTFN